MESSVPEITVVSKKHSVGPAYVEEEILFAQLWKAIWKCFSKILIQFTTPNLAFPFLHSSSYPRLQDRGL